MNVIGGIYRGKRLSAPEGHGVRPTGSKVREAVFDILGPAVEGAIFLDLFAGSGGVGIEALSRGADTCAFAEESPKALRFLRANLEGLNPPARWRLLPFPAPKALKVLRDTGFRADILFADPPYASREWPAILLSLPKYDLLKPDSVVVIEHAAATPPAGPPEWGMPRRYRYGDTALAVYRLTDETHEGVRGEA
jgi:16S rRNA (guanine966-N2)-methyltransferase